MYEIRLITNDGERALDFYAPSFPYTFESSSIAELQDQSASWSYTIEIPRTANNEQLFESAGVPFVKSYAPYRKVLCNVYTDGVQIIRRGVMYIDSTTKEAYNVQIVSGNADVFERMQEIDLTNWASETIIKLPLTTLPVGGDRYIFPPSYALDKGYINEQGLFTRITNSTRLLLNHIYWYAMPLLQVGGANGLLRRILADIGYTLVTDTPDSVLDALWLNLVTRNKKYEREAIESLTTNYYTRETAPLPMLQGALTTLNSDKYEYILRTRTTIPDNYYTDTDGNYIDGQIALEAYLNGHEGNLYNELGIRADTIDTEMETRHSYIEGTEIVIDRNNISQYFRGGTCEIVHNIASTYAIGSTRYLGVIGWLRGANFGERVWTLGGKTYNERIMTNRTAWLETRAKTGDGAKDYALSGESISLEANIGYDSAFDVFKMLAQVFGWIVDVRERTIYAHTFDYIASRKASAIDWSDKLLKGGDSMEFAFGEYAQHNTIKINENEYRPTLPYMHEFTIPNEAIERQKDILEIDIQPETANTSITWERQDDGSYDFKEGKKQLLHNVSTIVYSYDIDDIATHYQSLFEALQEIQVVTAQMMLTAIDIQTFDPYTPIYLQTYGAYFYVNKISDWVDGEPCAVELLRL